MKRRSDPPSFHAGQRLRLLAALVACLVAASGVVEGGRAAAAPAGGEPAPVWYRLAEDGSPRVRLFVFWSAACPHCERALPFVRSLAEEEPWLEVFYPEVSDPANAALYRRFAEALGVEAAYVPAFVYCGTILQGYDRAETTGRALRRGLTACRDRLAVALAAGQPTPEALLTEDGAPPPLAPVRVPLLGEVDPAALSLPVLTLVLAGLDAFNPCAFFVLLFLLSLLVHARSRARMLLVGGVFVLLSGAIYFAFMAAWLNLFLVVGHLAAVTTVAGAVAVLVGLLNVKDYARFRGGGGVTLSIPAGARPRLYERARGLVGSPSLPAVLAGTVALAVAANAYELLCTAGFPLVFTRILTLRELPPAAYYLYLALYNAVYVLPLLAIVVAFAVTLGSRKLREEEGRALKLLSGLMMLGLGLVLLLAPERLDDPLTALGLIAGSIAITATATWARRLRQRPATGLPEGR